MDEQPLNRQVAEKLGYYIYHYNKDRAENCYYLLQDEEGHTVARDLNGQRKTEADAWNDVPKWDSDIALTMSLLDGRTWTLESNTFTYSCRITPKFNGEKHYTVSADAESIEAAICKAFLQLDLEKEAKIKELDKARKQLAYQQQLVDQLESELSE